MAVIEAPELPKGYRFKVEKDFDGDICVSLEKKEMFFWHRVDRSWPEHLSNLSSLELKVQDSMLQLLRRNKEKIKEREEQSRVLGIYPPRKIIGETNE